MIPPMSPFFNPATSLQSVQVLFTMGHCLRVHSPGLSNVVPPAISHGTCTPAPELCSHVENPTAPQLWRDPLTPRNSDLCALCNEQRGVADRFAQSISSAHHGKITTAEWSQHLTSSSDSFCIWISRRLAQFYFVVQIALSIKLQTKKHPCSTSLGL